MERTIYYVLHSKAKFIFDIIDNMDIQVLCVPDIADLYVADVDLGNVMIEKRRDGRFVLKRTNSEGVPSIAIDQFIMRYCDAYVAYKKTGIPITLSF